MSRPRVLIVSPASAQDNNGNWRTAARWQRFLAGLADVRIARDWDGAPCDAMIALHARRSATAVAALAAQRPGTPIGLVLTGTDVYRDIANDATAKHSLECASQLVVLQPDALDHLPAGQRSKARVIVQSATAWRHRPSQKTIDLVAVGHLREEKDPRTLMAAARRLPEGTQVRIVHLGTALDATLAEEARRTMADCAHYRWLGGVPAGTARRWIARAHALVHMSRMEGGAQAVIEAVRTGVPVLASRIGGNVGLLGDDYAGYFEAGDSVALACLIERFVDDAPFAARLRTQCAQREPAFRPAAERQLVRQWLADLLARHASVTRAG